MGDFKTKGIYRLFVVVVQIGFPVVFQPILQRIFILPARQPVNTKTNIAAHRRDFFSEYVYQTNRYDFITFRTKNLQIFTFWGNADQFHLVPSKIIVEVGICTHRKLVFRTSFSCQFMGRQDTQRYAHTAGLCPSKKYFTQSIF